MHIETARTIVRNFTSEDAADLYEILGDDETMKYCELAYDFEKTGKFLASFCIDRNGAVAAVHKESGKMIGYILFNEFEADIYEMGWIYNRSFWRQGYAYESLKAVIDYAFLELNVHKIFAETIDGVRSVSLMQKLGMKFEGVSRRRDDDDQGNGTDLYLFGLLKNDWKTINDQTLT